MKTKKKIKRLAESNWENYGIVWLKWKIVEECGELITSLLERDGEDLSEMADVHNLIQQYVYLQGEQKEFKQILEAKVDRALSMKGTK